MNSSCGHLLADAFCANLDHSIAGWFHARLNSQIANGLYALSWPGSATWICIALGVAVLCMIYRRRWYGLGLTVLTVPGGMLLGEALKQLVQRQRPYVVGPFVDWSGYSFPSGHTMGATLLYGLLVVFLLSVLEQRLWRIVAIALSMFVIVLVGFSRIALGAHYLSDVVAAMLIGTLWLSVCMMLSRVVWRTRAESDAQSLVVQTVAQCSDPGLCRGVPADLLAPAARDR